MDKATTSSVVGTILGLVAGIGGMLLFSPQSSDTEELAKLQQRLTEISHFHHQRLAGNGIHFATETDTETVALLTQYHMDQGLSARDAAHETVKRLEGAYALCFLFDGEPDLLVAARQGSPLAIGYGDGEMFVGSDAIALSPMTDRITYLEEGDFAVVTRTSVEILDRSGRPANREIRTIAVDIGQVDKDGHKHFMD